MPELPEVEAVVRKLRADAVGARIRQVEVLRARSTQPQPADELRRAEGQTIGEVERRGKNIVLWLRRGDGIRIHLRMTGNLYVVPDVRLRPATARVVFTLAAGRGLIFDDPRVMGTVHYLTAAEIEKKLAKIGVDPLSRAFTAAHLAEAAARSKRPAKLFLMGQDVVSGLGNIYAAEALFQARIHPRTPVNRLRREQLVLLHSAIRTVLRAAVRKSVKEYRRPGYFEHMQFAVYGRKGEPCRVCGGPVGRIEQAGRSTYFCPRCQRAPRGS